MSSNKIMIKIVLLGDGRVGKTSIINKYFNDKFNDKEEMTINSCYSQKELIINGKKFVFCIWDTAGQEKFNALTPLYYRDANGAVLVFDLAIKETFQKVEKWVEELKMFNKDTEFVIAGNKFDLNKFDVKKEDVNDYSYNQNIPCFFTSAKTGDGINEMFDSIFTRLAKRFTSAGSDKKKGLIISEEESQGQNKKGCC